MAEEESPIAEETFKDPLLGTQTGTESALSSYAGPYVTEMLGQGQALADLPYEAYEGPLTAGPSALQESAFSGIAGLTLPTDTEMGTYTPKSITDTYLDTITDPETGLETQETKNIISKYMNPFLTNVVDDQITSLKLEADKRKLANKARMTAAGSYGGTRQALQEGLVEAKLLDDISQAINTGNVQAYERAIQQFNLEQDKERQAQEDTNVYGLGLINKLAELGGTQQAIEQAGITADQKQFTDELEFPYKQVQFMQSLLQGLPLETQSFTYAAPSQLANILGGTGGVMDLYNAIFGKTPTKTETEAA
jgi:hypothetical protein